MNRYSRYYVQYSNFEISGCLAESRNINHPSINNGTSAQSAQSLPQSSKEQPPKFLLTRKTAFSRSKIRYLDHTFLTTVSRCCFKALSNSAHLTGDDVGGISGLFDEVRRRDELGIWEFGILGKILETRLTTFVQVHVHVYFVYSNSLIARAS